MKNNLTSEEYKIHLNNFEGPLDLLCHLIEKNKMNIYDIPILEITDQYIHYINSMKEYNLEITAEFLIMASNLLYMKSKTLLPTEKEEKEEEELKEDLTKRILEYKKIKEIAEIMKKNNEIYSMMYYKGPEKLEFPKIPPKIDVNYPSNMLPEIFIRIAKDNMDKINHKAEDINRLVESEKVTVKSKIKEILRNIFQKGDIIFNKLFSVNSRSKIEVVTAFMAMLELDKSDKIIINQEYTFGDIKIKRLKNNV